MRIPGTGRAKSLFRRATAAVRRRSPRGIVLLYHRVAGPRLDPLRLDVSAANFAAHLGVLCDAATVLALDEFESLRRTSQLPPHAVAVTFDDGYADNLTAAAPLLTAQAVPSTIFVTSGMVGASTEFWWDDLERIALGARVLAGQPPVDGVRWADDAATGPGAADWHVELPGDPSSRHALYRRLVDAVRSRAPRARDDAMAQLRAWAGVDAAARATHRTLTHDELRTLAACPGITIGAHSLNHPVLALLPAHDQLDELSQSRRQLGAITAAAVSLVAYPYGTASDVSRATTRAARDAGFRAAYANEPACAWRGSSAWRVPRILVRDWSGAEFARRLAAWWAA